MTNNFELLDAGQIEIMHQQSHELDVDDNCDEIRMQHDVLAAELVKRGLPHDTEMICPESELGQVAPNYRRGFTDEICSQCAFGQLFPLCNLYKADYTRDYTCDSFQYFEVLELIPPHAYLMMSGKETAIASVSKLDIEKPRLIVSKGEAFGIVELEDPAQIKTKEFDSEEWQKQHRVTPRERRQWWPEIETFYVYRLKKWYSFGKSKVYEDNRIKGNIKLTSEQREQVSKGKELPKQVVLVEDAVMIANDNAFAIDPQVGHSQTLLDTLRATYECDINFDISDDKELQYQIPIYSLALVRNHKARPIAPKKSQKQEGETIMPFRIRKIDDEYCVLKVEEDGSDGDSRGCHDTQEEAEAQLTALNINVTAEEERAAHPDKKKKPKKKTLSIGDAEYPIEINGNMPENTVAFKAGKQFSVDEYPSVLRRQFQNKFNMEGRDIQPLEIFSSDSIPNMAGFIIANKDGGLFRIDYVTNDLGTTFADETMWIEVVPDFKPKGFTQVAEFKKEESEKKEEKLGFIDQMKVLAKNIGEYLSFVSADQEVHLEATTPLFASEAGMMQKKVNGELWHFCWSTNAFEDREGELFSTKALEKYVAENEAREDKGYFNLWHINAEDGNFNTDFAAKQWQGVVSRFLVEAGPYLQDGKGQSAKAFFSKFSEGHPEIAPEGWGCSPEFRYLPEEREKGIYENIWITRTSTLPKMAAANIWTDTRQARRKNMALSESQMKTAILAFGEDEVKRMLAEGERKTSDLEAANIAHKQTDINPLSEALAEKQEVAIDLEALAKEIGKQFQTDINPLSEALEGVKHMIVELSERVQKVEGDQKLKDLTETPSYIVSLRASANDKTIVTEDDGLKDKKPMSTENKKEDTKNVSPEVFFTPGN